MHIVNKGRDAFLEFLRNLTPQAFLSAASIILLTKVGDPWWGWPHIGTLAASVGLGGVVLLAVAANMWKFLDNAFSAAPWAARV